MLVDEFWSKVKKALPRSYQEASLKAHRFVTQEMTCDVQYAQNQYTLWATQYPSRSRSRKLKELCLVLMPFAWLCEVILTLRFENKSVASYVVYVSSTQ